MFSFLRIFGQGIIGTEELSKNPDQVKECLTSYSRNLIFIDNFELIYRDDLRNDLDRILSFLRGLPNNTQLLLTSRRDANLERVQDIKVNGLNSNEGFDLFTITARNQIPRNISDKMEEDIKNIVNLTGGHPLAIKILATNFVRGKFHFEKIHESQVLILDSEHKFDGRFMTILKCFDYSFQLLDKRIRRNISKLTIFQFPFTEHAAKEILKISTSDFRNVYESGFLERIDISERGLPLDILFYDFHPLVREFITRNKRKGYSSEDELVKYFVELIKKANHNDPFSRKTFNSLIANYYLRNNLKIFRRIIDAHHSLKKRSEIVNEVGLLLLKLGVEDEARQFHFECLELDNELQDRRRVVGDLRNIGLCFLRFDRNLALQYCIKALEEGKLIHYIDPMQYIEIGDIYLSKNQYDNAFRYYNDGYYFALGRERKDLQLVYCIHAISIYYFHKHNYLKPNDFR